LVEDAIGALRSLWWDWGDQQTREERKKREGEIAEGERERRERERDREIERVGYML
jgi:hypothetical protein